MVPVGCTLTATVVAWLVIPLILKSCCNESIEGTQVTPSAPFPYEASCWGALEDPLRCLIGFFALSLVGYLIAPLIVSNYVLPAWKGATMASFVLFLQRWNRSAFPHAFAVMVIYIMWISLAGEWVVLLAGKDTIRMFTRGTICGLQS